MTRYFAYGSNLVIERMEERGAGFTAASPAVLRDHRLVFDKRGFDGSARANVVPSKGSRVHGVLYELADGALEVLRGFESGYDLVEVQVELLGDDAPGHRTAWVFVARPDRRTTKPPTRSYVGLIIQGLEEHRLPAEARAEVERAAAEASGR